MKIALDQAIQATGACVFPTNQPPWVRSFTPRSGLHGLDKRKNMAEQILAWFDEIETINPGDPICCVSLEEFVKHVQPGRVESMMKVNDFTGYLRRAIEDWGKNKPDFQVLSIGKGTAQKTLALEMACKSGLAGCNEHEADAFYLGLLAGFADV